MNDSVKTATLVGDPVANPDAPVAPPKSREERILDYRRENRAAYEAAINAPHDACCSPTRQNALIIEAYQSPPID